MQEAGAQYAGWDGRFYHVPLLLGSISIFSQLLAPSYNVRPLFADNFSFESIYWLASCCLNRLPPTKMEFACGACVFSHRSLARDSRQ